MLDGAFATLHVMRVRVCVWWMCVGLCRLCECDSDFVETVGMFMDAVVSSLCGCDVFARSITEHVPPGFPRPRPDLIQQQS